VRDGAGHVELLAAHTEPRQRAGELAALAEDRVECRRRGR